MSECQYKFLAIDHPLDERQQAEVRALADAEQRAACSQIKSPARQRGGLEGSRRSTELGLRW